MGLWFEYILKHNNLIFHDRHYVQLNGTAMGTKMATSYVHLFMTEFERNSLYSANRKP